MLFYTARDGDNFLKLQVHRVGLDGKGDRRLTNPAFSHTVGGCMARASGAAGFFGAATGAAHFSDNKYLVEVAQTHDHPDDPVARCDRAIVANGESV